MENNEHSQLKLTASEISSLWTSYLADTMEICVIRYFLSNIKDDQIRVLLEDAQSMSEEHIKKVTQFFTDENYPVPQGFTEKDVNVGVPRLFSDKLYLEYMLSMCNFGLASYSLASSFAARTDMINFYTECLDETQDLHKKVKDLAKAKGTFVRAPHIPIPEQIDFVNKQSFLAGWFGERRPLLGVEIAGLVYNAKRNALGQAIITGFSQVAQSKEVRHYFEKGREISGKHLDIFTTILNESYLSNGTLLATPEVTDSTKAPFSDKLMMFLITTLIASGIGQYGLAMAASPRHDLGATYTRLIAEIAKYSNEAAKIMINKAWMEQPPIAADRKEFAK